MKQAIVTDRAPGAIGPYSQGIRAGAWIFCSGQLPINMQDGTLELHDIKKATRYSLENIRSILAAQGATMDDIVKTTVFLTDLTEFTAVNEVYATFFGDTPPARSCVQVASLPKGSRIEIEAIAVTNQ